MPIDYGKYPKNWKQLRQRVLKRANHCCEHCGVPNYATIIRSSVDPEQYLLLRDDGIYYTMEGLPVRMSEMPDEYAGKDIRIVLTTAHLNHDIDDNRMENLKALCQLHHLRLDKDYHADNARKTRAAKREAALKEAGQERLL